VTKLIEDHMVRVYMELHGLLIVVLRYFTVRSADAAEYGDVKIVSWLSS
jgi:UDP-glucose 4-epimerase